MDTDEPNRVVSIHTKQAARPAPAEPPAPVKRRVKREPTRFTYQYTILPKQRREVNLAQAAFHDAIREAYRLGLSLREIARATDLSHQRIHQIVRANEPPKGEQP